VILSSIGQRCAETVRRIRHAELLTMAESLASLSETLLDLKVKAIEDSRHNVARYISELVPSILEC
jgi:hypothetical protein